MTLYNEIEPYAAQWIRNLAAAGHVADGIVDERSIAELRADDLAGHRQAHFFAGIAGWSHALRLAGWPDDLEVWTGSCPCQPFSTAGKRRGFDDERHLWPTWFELIRECRPPIVFGEQVAGPAGRAWLDAVSADLEGAGYAVGAANLCAAGVGAPHIRQRIYFVAVADADGTRPQGWSERRNRSNEWTARESGVVGAVGDADRDGARRDRGCGDGEKASLTGARVETRDRRDGARPSGAWGDAEWIACSDGKSRPTGARLCLLDNGVSATMGSQGAIQGAKEVSDAKDCGPRPTEELRSLRSDTCSKAVREESGGHGCISAAQILRPSMHGSVHDRRDQEADPKEQPASVSEACEVGVRAMRSLGGASPCSPRRREPYEQRACEFADFVRLLPQAIALAELERDDRTARGLRALLASGSSARTVLHSPESVQALWRSIDEEGQARVYLEARARGLIVAPISPVTSAVGGRTGRLRGYGNAIVPQVAAEWIGAVMDAIGISDGFERAEARRRGVTVAELRGEAR